MITDKLQKKLNNGREYRSMVLEIRESEEQIVEGYATTFNEPYHLYNIDENIEVQEQVLSSAFEECDMSDVIFQYDHEGRVFARLSNGTMSLDVDDHGLKVTANLGGTTIGRNLYEEIKGGYTDKMSFGFIVGDSDLEEIPSENKTVYLRTIKSISKLFDVSAVSIPANNLTEISARNQIDGAIKEIELERLAREKQEAERKAKMENLANRVKALKGD